jgi:hypothetical protein
MLKSRARGRTGVRGGTWLSDRPCTSLPTSVCRLWTAEFSNPDILPGLPSHTFCAPHFWPSFSRRCLLSLNVPDAARHMSQPGTKSLPASVHFSAASELAHWFNRLMCIFSTVSGFDFVAIRRHCTALRWLTLDLALELHQL